MNELEAEVFLLGHWKNFGELEENISLPELQAILDAQRQVEHRHHKFMAALKGIDIDEGANNNQRRLEEIQRRANEKLYGREAVEKSEYFELGLEIEVEE